MSSSNINYNNINESDNNNNNNAIDDSNSIDTDEDLKRAIELSRQTYEEELKRRESSGGGGGAHEKNLIELRDQKRLQQIEQITKLYAQTSVTQQYQHPGCVSMTSLSAATPEWCRIRFPKAVQPQNLHSSTHLVGVNSFGAFPQIPPFAVRPSSSNPQTPSTSHSNDIITNNLSSPSVMKSPIRNENVIVPFRSPSTRLMNGDLIDLGNETDSLECGTLTYKQICDQFDPLNMNRSSNKGRAALSQSCSSGTLENRANSFDDDFICINSGATDETNKSLVRSQSIHSSSSTQTHAFSQNNYGQHTKPAGRPPPPKPERQNRVTTGRSGSVDSRRPQKSSPTTTTTEKNASSKIDVNNLQLIECTSEIDNEIASLKKRGPSESAAIACRFISPVLDYLITAFSVTSVKIIVEKDYSWPSIRSSSSSSSVREDKMVFTCETKCTIEEILISVLSFFLDPAQVELHNGCLPVDEYGLKIFGLDEFLLNSSQLGENPFVGQALMFGKDIRLEVGRTTARPYKITEHHEMWNINMSPASRLEKDQQHQKPSLKVSAESVERVIDVIKKEIKTSSTQFMHINTMKYRQAVKQSVKLLCTLLGKLMTYELIEALNIYTLATTMEQFETGTQMLIMAIHKFIGIYAKSTQSRFDVAPLNKDIAAVKTKRRREVVSVDERLLIKVESIHNLRESWQLRTFGVCIVVSVMHGSSELCTGFKDIMRPIDFDSAFFVYSHIDTWAAFDLPLCVLPRETRVVIVVYGLNRGADSGGVGVGVPGGAAVGTVPVAAATATNQLQINSATSPSVASSSSIGTNNMSESGNESCERLLAYTSFPLFDHNGIFRQGSIFVPLTLLEDRVVQPWGPRPLYENCDESTILVTLPEFEYDVVFPYVGFGERSTKREFETLDEGTQQYLLDIVEGGVTHCLTQCEMELLWEKRHYLTHMPSALPLVLISSVGWDWASLNNIYQLLDDWMPLSPIQAIELLLPNFPDMIIRERAITWLKGASSAFIFNFLPQLVEALRFETFENSSLAAYLLHLCAQDRRFAFEIYWQLQQRVDHCVEVTLKKRYMTMQEQIFNIMDNLFVNEIHNQHLLLRSLDSIGADMAETNDHNKMYSILQRHLALLDAHILENNIRLPILPSFLCIGIETKESNFFNSLTKPIKICFKGLKTTYSVLYKIGDDMRQDALVLQLVKVMNDIWLSEELDLRVIIFRCMPVGVKKGMIELVPDCQTLREIQSASGATGVFKDDVLKNWLEKHNPNEFQYKIALKNFELSCAGWCVATYVLGIGDRHNDNILVTTTGHVFHIDFGKYMGDWQMAGAFRRDRVPFIFTNDMAFVINEGSSQSATTRYQAFVDNCCKAFNLLRKKYSLLMNLMKLISCSNVPGMSMHAVNFVQNNLLLNLSDTEATAQFTRMIQESLASKFPRLNFFAHTLVQLRNAPSMIRGAYDDPNKLSFVPQLYSEKSEGRIIGVSVMAFQKWHIPEKVYMYKVQVKRQNENVSTIVYRSFAEFKELYVKLMRKFPIASLPSLSGGTNMGRSNISSVAQRRLTDIQRFLNELLKCHSEIAHCDLVYTFFHIIFRDSAPEQSNRFSQFIGNEITTNLSNSVVTGSIFLRLSYNERSLLLSIFVGHVKDLVTKNGQAPDSYVKTYLQPDPQRISKRKTRVIKNTQMPTFNEELNYQLHKGLDLNKSTLDVSVWNCSSVMIVGENCMIGMVLIPLRRFNAIEADRKAVRSFDSWFQLSAPVKHMRT